MQESKYRLLGDEYDQVISNALGKPVIMYGGHEMGPYLFYKGVLVGTNGCGEIGTGVDHLHFISDDNEYSCMDLWGIGGIILLTEGDHPELRQYEPDFTTSMSIEITEWVGGDGGGLYYEWAINAKVLTT